MERIDKILSSQNIGSRREVRNIIRQGGVILNGRPVKRPEEKANPEKDTIIINGSTLRFKRRIYIMMNKPKGVVCAVHDRCQTTVLDLLPQNLFRKGLFPAGRLDKDTEGLLILTDDGDFAHNMLSPKKHVYKLYEAYTDKPLDNKVCTAFKQGIESGGCKFLPAEIRLISPNRAFVCIQEGKYHQVKRMFEAVGTNVVYLKRLRIGDLFLDKTLESGQCRELDKKEIPLLLSDSEFSP